MDKYWMATIHYFLQKEKTQQNGLIAKENIDFYKKKKKKKKSRIVLTKKKKNQSKQLYLVVENWKNKLALRQKLFFLMLLQFFIVISWSQTVAIATILNQKFIRILKH